VLTPSISTIPIVVRVVLLSIIEVRISVFISATTRFKVLLLVILMIFSISSMVPLALIRLGVPLVVIVVLLVLVVRVLLSLLVLGIIVLRMVLRIVVWLVLLLELLGWAGPWNCFNAPE